MRTFTLALALTSLVLGCESSGSAPSGDFPVEPLATLSSDSGAWSVEVRTAPEQPPTRGESRVELTIRDAATGAPGRGLMITVTPWMPAMGHGSSVTPSVTESAPGTYVVTNVDLFMPGTWQLRTTISGTSLDHVAPSFDIP